MFSPITVNAVNGRADIDNVTPSPGQWISDAQPAAHRDAEGSRAQIRVSQVIGALSYALDLSEGKRSGHAARTCVLGMRLASELHLGQADQSALYYALMLKDVGASATGLRLGRSRRGARIARDLPVPPETAQALDAIDARYDGSGPIDNRAGDSIPLLSRIVSLCETIEPALARSGDAAALELARSRARTWFDPELVDLAGAVLSGDFRSHLQGRDIRRIVATLEPSDIAVAADDARLDSIAEGFAHVVDARSPFTGKHSRRVADYAVEIARVVGCTPGQIRSLRRAALLHDIGKLGLRQSIMEKPGKLTTEEFAEVRLHTVYTRAILWRVPAFREFADLAASHHERLDGRGYHRALKGRQLSKLVRILCVADQFEALTADRPYRGAMSRAQTLHILRQDAGTGLCPEILAGLNEFLATTPAIAAA
jgi:HD-GYP domain-containing protein (c-di-GMP phosphodiesterase class II)